MNEAVRKAQDGDKNRGRHRGTFLEGFIDDYARVRLIIALVALPLMLGFLLAGFDRLVMAIGFGVMAIHAAWNFRRGVRTPRLALALDITIINAAAIASVVPAITAAAFGFWCVLITFVTQGRSRLVFYGTRMATESTSEWPMTVRGCLPEKRK